METSVDDAPSVELDDVSVAFPGSVWALRGVSLSLPGGEVTALVGPSGCGKSTILRTIAGLQSPTNGRVAFTPETFRRGGGRLNYVFQDAALVPWRSALGNVSLPLELAGGLHGGERCRDAAAMLARVDLAPGVHQRRPAALSGGMQMRVAIARALVTKPRVLLMDEPFAALDEMLRLRLCRLTLELWHERRPTIVFVTHNISEAILMSHRIAVMGQGNVVEVFANDVPWPRTAAVQDGAPFRHLYQAILARLEGEYART